VAIGLSLDTAHLALAGADVPAMIDAMVTASITSISRTRVPRRWRLSSGSGAPTSSDGGRRCSRRSATAPTISKLPCLR
jgi:hypothetical protein